jgi:cytochrome P450
MSATSSVAGPQELLLQLLDPANRANPYAVYERFRDRGPMRLPDANLTVFSSYRDCDEALRHPSSSVDRLKSTVAQRMLADGTTERPQVPPMFLFPKWSTRWRRTSPTWSTGCSAGSPTKADSMSSAIWRIRCP